MTRACRCRPGLARAQAEAIWSSGTPHRHLGRSVARGQAAGVRYDLSARRRGLGGERMVFLRFDDGSGAVGGRTPPPAPAPRPPALGDVSSRRRPAGDHQQRFRRQQPPRLAADRQAAAAAAQSSQRAPAITMANQPVPARSAARVRRGATHEPATALDQRHDPDEHKRASDPPRRVPHRRGRGHQEEHGTRARPSLQRSTGRRPGSTRRNGSAHSSGRAVGRAVSGAGDVVVPRRGRRPTPRRAP